MFVASGHPIQIGPVLQSVVATWNPEKLIFSVFNDVEGEKLQ